jgi:hypothetical protein
MGQLRQLLEANATRRASHAARPGLATRLARLRAWQSARLRQTYADLSAQPRYAAAVNYFVDELYGGTDLAPRDRDLQRAAGALERLLPRVALSTLEESIQLEMETQALDAALAAALPADTPLDAASYATAYRSAAPRFAREEQLTAIVALGGALDRLVRMPGLGLLLRLTRAPAEAAGLGVLQGFLERGYAAFRATGGAEEFLAIVGERESQLLDRLYRKDARALEGIAP